MVLSVISIAISVFALCIAGLTFYFARLMNGTVAMTKPAVIFFGPDGGSAEQPERKVFIRTLLFSTADKGQYIQNMYVRLHRHESVQNFNIWVYGDESLVRGSGLFVSKSGISFNHHFLMPKDGTVYDFLPGEYLLEVFVETTKKPPFKIFEQKLIITEPQYDAFVQSKGGIYYDWAPNSRSYHAHVNRVKKKDIVFPDIF